MHKNLHISKWLMYVSVLIIILFQVYWLKRVYNDTYRNLQREISVELREAFLKRQFQTMFGDSATRIIKRDTVEVNGSQLTVVRINDTVQPKANWKEKDTTIRFEVRAENRRDSGRVMGPGGPPRIMAFENAQQDFEPKRNLIITLPVFEKDFNTEETNEVFSGILKHANLPYTFAMRKAGAESEGQVRMRQGSGRMGRRNFQMIFAELDFGNAFPIILPKMWLQISLALFMTGMIILAFRFMYRSLKEQQKMAALKNDFISNMTHELKTPIATVSVALEALKNFSAIDNPQRTKEYLDISSAELNRLSMLVDKVLRINMFEAEKLELDKHPVDLATITQEVVQAQQLQAEKIGAVIQWQSPSEPCIIKGDKLHLMSVLYNLLDNSMKYRSENPEIKVAMERKGDKIYWSVQDNGPGIAAEYKARVFEKFFRVPQGDRHDIKGYGLGLSYVHDVVQKHGGIISVDSEPGKGSIFTVELPLMNT
jgi:two-component system phosphate regulon sensor histidine kinase PhoR